MLLALLALLVLAGCPRSTRKTLVPEVPQTGNPTARARFLDARSQFLRDGHDGDFAKIVEDYPDDPIAPWAELYAGIAALKGRDFASADAQLAKVMAGSPDPGLTLRAQLFLGIAKNYEGDTASARKLLVKVDAAIENDDERTEYLAALGYATADGERPLAALPVFDELYGRVTPTERAAIVERIEQLVAAAPPDAVRRAYDEVAGREGPSRAIAGGRVAELYAQAGDAAHAAQLRDAIAQQRLALGLPRTATALEAAPAGGGNPGLVGAALPLGSAENRVAEKAIAGLGLAAGALDGKGVVAIETRAAPDKTAAAEVVDQLANDNVIAIVGPIDGAAVDAAGGRAEGLGVPLLSLATAPEQRATGRFVFHIRHSAEARARMLAQRALKLGVTRFAVFAPDNGYGKAVGAAFADAVQKGGGTIVTRVSYPKDAKSFTGPAGKLGDGWQAVFVPDVADRLALVAPALAATGAMPRPLGTRKVIGGRPVLLLSTAEDLASGYLAEAGRHSDGALLAPGFYPDDADPLAKPFIDRFVAAYGRPPGATEAYAYDAAQLVAAAGARGRAALADALAKGQLAGVTGTIAFDADHRRADPGTIYTVVVETGNVYAIRAER
ncbi:MAG TPA: penicillin-binding protein activator [Kofleriaceae bacterium]|nr:penicillin-binding protein activator [Kofleriaceae bacterium]